MTNALGLKAHHITGRVLDIDAVLALPGYSISFVQFDEPERGAAPGPAPIPHWVHPVFSVADPDVAYRLPEAKGVKVATHGPKPPVVKVFQCYDCEGNQLEIVAEGVVY